MGITGVNTGIYSYQQSPLAYNPNQSASLMPSLLDNTVMQPTQYQSGYGLASQGCTDDKDDGKIGFWKATGYLLKGGLKFFTSPFCDENGDFSIKQTIKSAVMAVGIAAAASLPVIGPLVIPTLLATGITFGALGTANAAVNILTADTDAEDKAAWESLGKNATALGMSIFGAKKYAAAKLGHDVTAVEGVKQVFKEPIDAARDGINSMKNASLGSLAEKTGMDRVINGIRPSTTSSTLAESTSGAAGGAGAAAGEAGAGAGASTATRRPLFNDTRQWIVDHYHNNQNLTLGELTSKAYQGTKAWAYDHGFRNNIRGYELPFGIAAYDTLS